MVNEPRRVNRAVAAQANVFFINAAHIKPLGFSIIFGFIVGQVCQLDLWPTLMLMAWPFSTWLIVVGKEPRKFLAKFHRRNPRWIRTKVRNIEPFHKQKVGLIRGEQIDA